ncbi:alpha/beta hydrolase [Aerococcus kribbianus]|uniref:Alpha/beta hydrolase n=1 Tax=Aerococcus kribbianus TaxID=2999064 RepID=A0A9X3JFV4_9LACT|nr:MULTISPECIES: alpha/beta hydrolase [unclassified Aerococcus]MCZ0717442.1 alpha/beta hydrolase [Aerococcus sp. YH-aer221]MCZ0725730.1 alpha/beta hydrolase [Aerococcus sp. YH-aer222]
MSKNNHKKRWPKIVGWLASILVLLSIIATIVVGNYFVDYALVPNSGGADRDPVVETLPEGTEKQSKQTAQIIAKNKALEEDRVDTWLENTKSLHQDVSIKSDDGLTLRGEIFKQDKEHQTNKWAVIVHGYQVNKEHMYPVSNRYYEEGYNILTYDQRGLGESQGDYITMAIKEKYDLINWLEFLIAEHPDSEIVTHGQSLGAATVMSASGLDDFPDQVIAVIEDSGYSSVWGVFESELHQRFALPAFPALHMAGIMAYFRADINIFSDGQVTDLLAKSTTPTLYIHGTADDFVPYQMVHDVYNALPIAEKERYIAPEAAHSESKYLDPDDYYQTVFDFIDQYDKQ